MHWFCISLRIYLCYKLLIFKGSTEFTVDDLQSSTTYHFNILASNEKGDSEYTTDNVQKTTEATPPAPDSPGGEDDTPRAESPPEPPTYSDILVIIASIGGCLLVCNLALLYCYIQRKNGRNIFGSSDSTMSRSSILEMYFSSSSHDTRSQSSQSINSDVDDTLDQDDDEDDSDVISSRERVDMWRQGQANSRYHPDYTPSPPPWPQDPRRRPWQQNHQYFEHHI